MAFAIVRTTEKKGNHLLKQNIITSTLVSSSIVLLSILFTPEPATTTVVHPDDNYQSVAMAQVNNYPQNTESSNSGKTKQLVDQIETLLSKQQALVNKNFILEQRISELEDSTQTTMQDNYDNGYRQAYTMSPEEVEQDEQMVAMESEQLAMEFDNLTAELQNEDLDANWSAAMDIAFSEIEQRLQALNINSVSISQKQCGSESCLVEYTLDTANQDQPPVMDNLLAAQGASEVIVKHVEENGRYKILALYKR